MSNLIEQATGPVVDMDDGLPRGDEDSKLNQLIEWIDEYNLATERARDLSQRDRDFYDGNQWTNEERVQLSKRNQPEVVMNRIFPRVNDTLGAEAENMTDPRAFPRSFDAHNDESEAATDALRYWNDVTQFDEKSLMVLDNLAIEGAGGCVFELGVEPDPGSNGKKDRNVIQLRYVPWDRLIWDPHSRLPDFSDALFKGITTWLHYSEALRKWPDKKNVLEQVRDEFNTGDFTQTHEDKPLWFHTGLQRVAVREIWYRELDQDGNDLWKYTAFVHGGFVVEPKVVEWRDDSGKTVCPLLMTSAFITRENLYRYGMVRNMISPQEEVNKRRSKALHQFVADRVLYEEGAVEEPNVMKRELAKPDGAVKLNTGALQDGAFQIISQVDRGQAHLALEQEAKAEIDELGPHANLPSGVPQDLSARSFFAQQQAGMRKVGPLFTNFRKWKLDIYRFAWYGIREFWPEERWLRIRDKDDSMGYRFVKINQPMTRGERVAQLVARQDPIENAVQSAMGVEGTLLLKKLFEQAAEAAQMISDSTGQEANEAQLNEAVLNNILQSELAKERFKVNDVSKLDVDIIIDVTPSSTILEHEQFTQLGELARNGFPIPPEAIIKASFLPNKREILDSMQQQADPQEEQLRQQQIQLQLATMQAQIQKLEAEAQAQQAKAQQLAAAAAKAAKEAELMIPAEAERDQAQSEKLRAEAGTLVAKEKAIPIEAEAKRTTANKPTGSRND